MASPRGNAARFRVGTQGWSYPAWVGPFYPSERQGEDLLSVYAEAFDAVEVNSTFYAIPDGGRVASWKERTPAGFRFTLKLPGEITHERRLRDCRAELTTFLLRAELLGEKLGPLLIQLPPDFTTRAREDVERFVAALPADFPFAIEFRSRGWLERDTLAFLDDWGIAPAISVGPWRDGAAARALLARGVGATGPFVYARWMGDVRHRYGLERVEVERDEELDAWARALKEAATGDRIVWAFFNNDWQGHSPASARALQRRLGIDPVDPASLETQGRLF